MRIRGRKLYPDNLRERRLMMELGGTPLHAPRGISPYLIARRLTRAAAGNGLDVDFVRGLLVNRPRRPTQPRLTTQQPGTTSAPTSVAA